MNIHPLVIPAAAYVLGVLACHWLDLPWWPFLALAAGSGLALAVWAVRRRALPVWGLTLFCLFLGAGLLGWERSGELPQDHVRHLIVMRNKTIIADVMTAPERTPYGWRLLVDGTW